jgi:CBS domain-containing protein
MFLKVINKYKLDYAIIINKDQRLKGIITDGSIRDSLLNNLDDLNQLEVEEMLNLNPILIYEFQLISDAFEVISKHRRQILFLPVVDKNHRLKGVVSIAQLIRGNL